MSFHSILCDGKEANSDEKHAAPDFIRDLNIDQIVGSITMGRDEYNLTPFFYRLLSDQDAVVHRQQIFRELETPQLDDIVRSFAESMQTMRSHLRFAARVHYTYQKERWFLNAVDVYSSAVAGLASDLAITDLTSAGLLGFRDYLSGYTQSGSFTSLQQQTRRVLDDLGTVRYCLLIKDDRITVGGYDGETDYSASVVATFARFQPGGVKDRRTSSRETADMDHLEAGILDLVAKLYPAHFLALDSYYVENRDYLDPTIDRFDREIQFYLAYLDYLAPLREAGLQICYPEVSAQSKEVHARDTFDLALAAKLTREGAAVVCNDIKLSGPERILVVSGPNQGGKTTLARTFGQLHYLALLGCPVPGRDAKLFVSDHILTHFEREEDITTLAGELENELQRIHAILQQATPGSIIVLNESFTSTTLSDALFLSEEILGRISALDALCVCVTFLDELSTLNEKTVSVVSTVQPDDPATRTYKVLRRPADGRAYALAIAEKYRLTYDSLKGRVAP